MSLAYHVHEFKPWNRVLGCVEVLKAEGRDLFLFYDSTASFSEKLLLDNVVQMLALANLDARFPPC